MLHRDPYLLERDLTRYRKLQPHLFPKLETTPDLSRYETRLAAEVALAILQGPAIPVPQAAGFRAARVKAFETLNVLAKG